MKFSFQHRAFYCYLIMTLWILFLVTAMYRYIGLRTEEAGGVRRTLFRQRARGDSKLRRLRSEHCHPVDEIKRGAEGAPSEESWRLQGVVVVTRHGDRGPLTHVRGGDTLPCNTVPASTALRSYSEFVWNASAGGRAPWVQAPGPFHNFPTLPVSSAATSCALGQLTLLGVDQMLATGEILKEAYAARLGWAETSETDSNKQAAGEVVAYSTRYRRTFQSALALLSALPPRAAFAARAAALRESHSVAFCFRECACPRATRLQQKLSAEARSRLESQPAVAELAERMSRIVFESPERADVDVLRDALLAAVCHRAPPPCAALAAAPVRRTLLDDPTTEGYAAKLEGDARTEAEEFRDSTKDRIKLSQKPIKKRKHPEDFAKITKENILKLGKNSISIALYNEDFSNKAMESVPKDNEGNIAKTKINKDLGDKSMNSVLNDNTNSTTKMKYDQDLSDKTTLSILKGRTNDALKTMNINDFEQSMNEMTRMQRDVTDSTENVSNDAVKRREYGHEENRNLDFNDYVESENGMDVNVREKTPTAVLNIHLAQDAINNILHNVDMVEETSGVSLEASEFQEKTFSHAERRHLLETDIDTLNLELDYINNQLNFNNAIGRKARDIIDKSEKAKPLPDFDTQMEKEKLSYYRQRYMENADPNYDDVVVVKKHLDSDFNFNMEKEMGGDAEEESYPEVTPQGGSQQECIRREQLASLFAYVDWSRKLNAKSPNSRKKATLNAYGFIHHIVRNMIRMISESKPKLVYYSGHDRTIQALVTALGLTEYNVYYASRMIFEVYRRADELRTRRRAVAQDFYFRALLNGADVTDRLSCCRGWHNVAVGGGGARARLCPIENIVRLIHDDYFAAFNATNFKDACATTQID